MLNRDISRLAFHSTLANLGANLSVAFSAGFLLRLGFSPAQIFICSGMVLGLRFVLRPLVLVIAPLVGLRCVLILGTALCAASYLTLGRVQGIDFWLAAYVGLLALGQVFYCLSFHVYFATVSAERHLGVQVSLMALLNTFAGAAGPAAGGLLLATHGPSLSFALAALVTLAAIVPVWRIGDVKIAGGKFDHAFSAARLGATLFALDGWIQTGAGIAWSIILFQALRERYDSFGGTLSLAAIAGAIGSVMLGRLIDRGHGRPTVWINGAISAATVLARAAINGHPGAAVLVAVVTTLFGGFNLPAWITVAYREARRAPCSFRFQFAAEGGWDVGGAAAGAVAAAMCGLDLPVNAVVLTALPVIALQGFLLHRSYAPFDGVSLASDGEAPFERAL